MDRVILHSDCNCFYASVEMLHHPEYGDRPLAVGGNPEERHGIILTANYPAKRMGVKTGMALWQALQAVPDLIIVPPHYDLYMRFSKLARNIYADYTDLIEPFGLDESWLDVTASAIKGSGMDIAEEISRRIKKELGITVSIGVSWNKIFAKFGSDYKKPDTITEITKDNYRNIVWSKPVGDLLYVGRATQNKLSKYGIQTIGQLANTDEDFLNSILGKMGNVLYSFSNGYDLTPVAKMDEVVPVKSIGNGITTARDLLNNEDVKYIVYMLSESVARRLRKHHFVGSLVAISVRDNDLLWFTRQQKIDIPTNLSSEIAVHAMRLFIHNYNWSKPVRNISIRVGDLHPENCSWQIDIFTNPAKRDKMLRLERAVDIIRRRF